MKVRVFSFGLLFLFLTLVGGSCRKMDIYDDSGVSMNKLRVSAGFDWESSRLIHLTVGIDLLPYNIGKLGRIAVYDQHPDKNGKLLITGAAGYESPFEYQLRIPSTLLKIYLRAETGNGFSEIDSVATSDEVNYVFSQTKKSSLKTIGNDPDCSNATPSTTLSGSQTYNISDGGNYYVTGTFSGSVNFGGNGGIITVCGTMNAQNINNTGNGCIIQVAPGGTFSINNLVLNSGGRLIAYSNSHVAINGMNMNGSTAKIINFCDDFMIGSQFSPNGSLENYGVITMNGGLNINSNAGLFINTGTMDINGNFNMNSSLTNDGTILVSGAFNLNSGTLYQNCKMLLDNNLMLNTGSIIMNGGYLKVNNLLQINSGAIMQLQNNSMISAGSYGQNANVQGSGSGNEIVISGQGYINGSNKVSGPIEMVTTSGTLSPGNSSNFINGATLRSIENGVNVIPVTECNPEGYGGTPAPPDSDGDGVTDDLDQYPADAGRAFNNYYPSQVGFGTLAFEDMWPYKADYDLNDLVVDYQYQMVTNARNQVVDIKASYSVRAAGAGFRNGFGLQIDGLMPGQVASVSGCSPENSIVTLSPNGVESNQDKAVIIVFDNFNNVVHRGEGASFFNTVPGDPKGYGDTLHVNIHLKTPLAQSVVGSPPFNAFMIKDMQRELEIHLADYPPTSLADAGLFGTGNDDSNPSAGRYYKTSNNLPWALNLPVKFDYTPEQTPIVLGYNYFGSWAESAGAQYTNWYSNQNGYRNDPDIYR